MRLEVDIVQHVSIIESVAKHVENEVKELQTHVIAQLHDEKLCKKNI